MMNPMSVMKIMKAKKEFTENHPKFVAFLGAIFRDGMEEDTVIEISVQKPGQNKVTSNLKIKLSDLELLQELKSLAKEQ